MKEFSLTLTNPEFIQLKLVPITVPDRTETGVAQSVSEQPSVLKVTSSIPVSFDRRLFQLSSDPCSCTFGLEGG